MVFPKKINRVFKNLKNDNKKIPAETPELEKQDYLAMLIAAFLVIIPTALAAIAVIVLFGYFFLAG